MYTNYRDLIQKLQLNFCKIYKKVKPESKLELYQSQRKLLLESLEYQQKEKDGKRNISSYER